MGDAVSEITRWLSFRMEGKRHGTKRRQALWHCVGGYAPVADAVEVHMVNAGEFVF